MKTPDEIKKGLEFCITGPCPGEGCPFYKGGGSCGFRRNKDALAYIRQLEEERRNLVEALRSVDGDCHYCAHGSAIYAGKCDAINYDCAKCIGGSNYECNLVNRKTSHREPNIKAVYLAGKMAGLHDLGRSSFLEAEEVVRKKGHVVLNPASLPEGLPHDRYMPMCMSMINAADAVVLLEGWEDSPGAQVEKAYAEYQKKPVFKIQELREE